MVWFADSIGIESVLVALGIDKDGVVLAIEGTPDGGRTVIGPDDFI